MDREKTPQSYGVRRRKDTVFPGKMGRIANEGEWPRNSRDVNMQWT